MIRLNCFFQANPESETAYKDALRAAVALTEKSRKHAGCIAYAEVSPLSGETGFRRKGQQLADIGDTILGGRRSFQSDGRTLRTLIEACGQLKLEKFEF